MGEHATLPLHIVTSSGAVVRLPDEVTERLASGDRPLVLGDSGEVLLIPAAQQALVDAAVARARAACVALRGVSAGQTAAFYEEFARRLADPAIWEIIATANAEDVRRAQALGHSTTRLLASARLRQGMIDGLHAWQQMPPLRGRVVETIWHEGWRLEQVLDGLGVVGFVFEGRPNVFADATGLLRGGNAAVLRIGSDALGTARAIARMALQPALAAADLPAGAIELLDSPERSAGWALFAHRGLAMAVARGSGAAVRQLGAIARQAGTPVSLHGTGGAWMVADASASPTELAAAVYHSLDRKVCNTLNTLCLVAGQSAHLLPVVLDALARAGERLEHGYRLHATAAAAAALPAALFATRVDVLRAEGSSNEPIATLLPEMDLGREWEWEATPELSLTLVESVDEAIHLFNTLSPRFAASLISSDPSAHAHFYAEVDAPFVGNGTTRWVDGQYALNRPELGLSGWEQGRLLGRSGILTGDDIVTVRMRVQQTDPTLHR